MDNRRFKKSISVKNKLRTNFINKEEFHTNYKKYRNLLSTFIKKSKQAYYDKYFERHWINTKSTWKGKDFSKNCSSLPTVLSLENGDTITSPYDSSNTFDNYFASIAKTTRKKHKIFA